MCNVWGRYIDDFSHPIFPKKMKVVNIGGKEGTGRILEGMGNE
jgi:hypothetical protein